MRLAYPLSVICTAAALFLVGCDRSESRADADVAHSIAPAATPEAIAPVPDVTANSDSTAPVPDATASSDSTAAVSFNAAQTADTDIWYTASDGATACTMSPSPGQEVDRLQAQGATTTTADNAAADGTLIDVVVRWTDTGGAQSATYFRKLGDCEATLPQAQVIPDRYKR